MLTDPQQSINIVGSASAFHLQGASMTEDQQAEIIMDAMNAMTPVIKKLIDMPMDADDYFDFMVNFVCTMVSGGAKSGNRNAYAIRFLMLFTEHICTHMEHDEEKGMSNGSH